MIGPSDQDDWRQQLEVNQLDHQQQLNQQPQPSNQIQNPQSVNNPNVNDNQIQNENQSRQSVDSMVFFSLTEDEYEAIGMNAKPQLIKQILLTFSISFYQLITVVLCIFQLYTLRNQEVEDKKERIENTLSLYEIFLICMIIFQVEDNFFWNFIRCKQYSILRQVSKHSYPQTSLSRQFIQYLHIFILVKSQGEEEEDDDNSSNIAQNNSGNNISPQLNRILKKVDFFLVQGTLYSILGFGTWRRLQLVISWAFFGWGQYFLFKEKRLFCILFFLVFYIYIPMITLLVLYEIVLFIIQFILKTCFKSLLNIKQIKKFAKRHQSGIEIDKFPILLPPSSSSPYPQKLIISKMKDPINKFSIQTTTTLPRTEILSNKKQNDNKYTTEENLNALAQFNPGNKDKINKQDNFNLEIKQVELNDSTNKIPHELIECELQYNDIMEINSSQQENKQNIIQNDDGQIQQLDKDQQTEKRKSQEITINNFKDSCCSVCLVDFKPNELVYRVKCCRSIFHTTCMLEWFRQSKSCPNCRKKF